MEQQKTCYECVESKPLESAFYRHPGMTTGFVNLCKDCHKKRMLKRHNKIMSTEKSILKERKRSRDKYHKLNYKDQYPRSSKPEDKNWARSQIGNALRGGRIKPDKECVKCGHDFSKHRREAHHEDYSKPLDVMWLCSLCHGKRHRK